MHIQPVTIIRVTEDRGLLVALEDQAQGSRSQRANADNGALAFHALLIIYRRRWRHHESNLVLVVRSRRHLADGDICRTASRYDFGPRLETETDGDTWVQG